MRIWPCTHTQNLGCHICGCKAPTRAPLVMQISSTAIRTPSVLDCIKAPPSPSLWTRGQRIVGKILQPSFTVCWWSPEGFNGHTQRNLQQLSLRSRGLSACSRDTRVTQQWLLLSLGNSGWQSSTKANLHQRAPLWAWAAMHRSQQTLGWHCQLQLQPLGQPRAEGETPPGKMQETLSCSSFSLPPSFNAVKENYLCFLTDTFTPRLRHWKLFCMEQKVKGSSSSQDY